MKAFAAALLLAFPSIAASLTKRDCDSFDLTAPGPKGWSRMGQPIRVSEIVNCTAERAKKNGDGKGNCNIQRYIMGIIANATINSTDGATFQAPSPANLNTSMTNKKAIIKALKHDIGPLGNVTLDRLVVIPFIAPFNTTPNGTYGYWTFTPAIQCWRGHPRDCDGDLEEELDGYSAVVCGFRLKSNSTDDPVTTYEGNVSFVEMDEEDGLIKSEIRPWPSLSKAQEWDKEWDEADVDSGAGNKKSILEAVRDIADSKMMEYVNLQRLAVIPCANSSWPGTLDDCDNNDDLDDTEVVVCGFRIDRKGSNESDAEYRGRIGFVEDNDPNSRIKPGVRPWLDYEEAVGMAEEWERNDV
ncbi:unnamed protein product [Fusarium fujikuroi]|uniref:Ecp2 effector protein domain-containing protein n=1 Tax=Fusarium fujikuroi TaxID=5127 RepID=A0A9Q9RT81_FUSFU|nr:unnamed protein product [Fusarium fujikuroi]